EQRHEHRNALHAAPIFGRQTNYLKALAAEMTRRGSVALPDADARAVVSAVTRELAECGQIEAVGAPAILAALTAHHILERIDYPDGGGQFEDEQFQEFYAALVVHARLLDLQDGGDAVGRFAADYVNDPAWAEPLRMVAETLDQRSSDVEKNRASIR